MFFLLTNGIEFFSTAAVLLPVFLFLHGCCYRKLSHTLWCYCLAVYFGTVYALTGLPTVQLAVFEPHLYWIPFAGFFNDLRNSILNMLLFVPLGFFLPLLCRDCKGFRKVVIIGFLCSLGIELAQLFTYRITDINDLMNNTLGAALGYLLFTRIRSRRTVMTQLSPGEIAAAGAAAVLCMFFLQQTLASYFFRLIF